MIRFVRQKSVFVVDEAIFASPRGTLAYLLSQCC